METTHSLEEIAKALDVCEKTVLVWIRSGELQAVNVSRCRQSTRPRLRVRSSDLDTFLASRATSGAEPKRQRRRQAYVPKEIIK